MQAISHSPNSSPLILTYVRTAKPLLVEPDDIELYTFALLDASLLEAWQFQRSFAETDPTRQRLLKKIFDWCVTRKSFQNNPAWLIQTTNVSITPYSRAHSNPRTPNVSFRTKHASFSRDPLSFRVSIDPTYWSRSPPKSHMRPSYSGREIRGSHQNGQTDFFPNYLPKLWRWIWEKSDDAGPIFCIVPY